MIKKIERFIKSKDIINIGIKTIILMILAGIIIPTLVYKNIYSNSYYFNLSNNEWMVFLGSILGGLIAGIGTLMAVLITTAETRRIQNENIKNNNKPVLILEEKNKGTTYLNGYRDYVGYDFEDSVQIIKIKNIGTGLAKNIKVTVWDKTEKEETYENYKNIIGGEHFIEDIKIQKDSEILQAVRKPIYIDYEKPLEIYYEDMFNNSYVTKYKIGFFRNNNSQTKLIRIEETIGIGEKQ